MKHLWKLKEIAKLLGIFEYCISVCQPSTENILQNHIVYKTIKKVNSLY